MHAYSLLQVFRTIPNYHLLLRFIECGFYIHQKSHSAYVHFIKFDLVPTITVPSEMWQNIYN